jgi:quercetin dioxygenase-like cupin family protein
MRVCLSVILFAATLVAQTATVEITKEPHHHPILENSYVRAFKVEILPGDETLLHHHGHDYLYVMFGPARITNQVQGKPIADATLRDGQASFAEGNMAHVVHNVGATPFRNITVELLRDKSARQSPPPQWEEERGLHILDKGTQDIMFVKDGVRVSEVDLQPGGMIGKHRHVGPHMLIALTDLDLRSDVEGKGTSKVEVKSGDIRWVPGGLTHTLMNAGSLPAKFITFEFH